jgi:hypothetical protein
MVRVPEPIMSSVNTHPSLLYVESALIPATAPHDVVGSRTCHTSHHCATMPNGPGYHNRQPALAAKIRNLLRSLSPSTYNEVAPKIEYWIEYVIAEEFTTIDDLVEQVSPVAWGVGSYSDISRFLKEFRDTPRRSESMRSFVDQLCTYVLRWFAIAAAEDIPTSSNADDSSVTTGGWSGFARAASFVGHLIECGLISHDLARRHLVKPLITHFSYDHYRARAIYELFNVPGNSLLQGLLDPGDVQVCFKMLDILGNISHQRHSKFGDTQACHQIFYTLSGAVPLQTIDEGAKLYTAKLNVRCDPHLDESYYDLTCVPGTSRDPCSVVVAQGG